MLRLLFFNRAPVRQVVITMTIRLRALAYQAQLAIKRARNF
jgi:hypothetical protein